MPHHETHRHTDRRDAADPQRHQRVHEPAFGWYPHEHKVLDSASVWLVWGRDEKQHLRGSGMRVENDPDVIAATIDREVPPQHTTIEVHDGRCNLGMTTPDPCDCYPTVVSRG